MKRMTNGWVIGLVMAAFMFVGTQGLRADEVVITGPTDTDDAVIAYYRVDGGVWTDCSLKNMGGADGGAANLSLNSRDAQEHSSDPGVGYDAQQKMLFRFNVSAIPAGSTINSATFEIYNNWSNGATVPIYQVLKPWVEGNGGFWGRYPTSPDGVSYAKPDISQSATWDALGLQAGTDRAASAAGTIGIGGAAPAYRVSTDLATLVQAWVDGTADNYGVLLQLEPTTGNVVGGSNPLIATSDAASNQPILRVNYTAGSGAAVGTVVGIR